MVDSVTFSTPLGGRSVTLTADQLDAAARGGQALSQGAEQERLIEDDLPEFLRIYEEARWRYLTAKDALAVHVLRTIAAPVRFLSCEPLLEPLGRLDLSGIAWVIPGGESGSGYRAMDHSWAREIRDACVEQGVAMFFKQSSGPRSEMNPTLLEEDGSRTEWHQWPAALPAAFRT